MVAVVLAAGKGTRMKSDKPKVLHNICGKPMIDHVIDSIKGAGIDNIVVIVGHKGEEVQKSLGKRATIVFQHEQLGTAHALLQAHSVLEGFTGHILVVCGDTPLVSSSTLSKLVEESKRTRAAAIVLTAFLDEPTGYGRIIRDSRGEIIKIVEQKDASPDELIIKEINTGIYCFAAEGLFEALSSLKSDNAQGEYYLTDVIAYYKNKVAKISTASVVDPVEIMGINDRKQMAFVESVMRVKIQERLMLSGVTIIDPNTTYINDSVIIGKDTIIYPFTILEGNTTIGRDCEIGPNTRLINVTVGDNTKIVESNIIDSRIDYNCDIGPYAYIRPGCLVGKNVKIGDFVELKNTTIGNGSKVPHLTYMGDSQVGENVNIGAGTITCNYDGRNKHITFIDDGAFIGSNANLVAPVRIGKKAVIGAGSTITRDVPPGSLGVARNKQKVYDKWNERKGENEE